MKAYYMNLIGSELVILLIYQCLQILKVSIGADVRERHDPAFLIQHVRIEANGS